MPYQLPIEQLAFLNSLLCIIVTATVTLVMRNARMREQLKALKAITSYSTATLLFNLYLVGIAPSTLVKYSLALSAIVVPLLWFMIYTLWAKGE